jgi:hypothetical protein
VEQPVRTEPVDGPGCGVHGVHNAAKVIDIGHRREGSRVHRAIRCAGATEAPSRLPGWEGK